MCQLQVLKKNNTTHTKPQTTAKNIITVRAELLNSVKHVKRDCVL